jgi:hypothetical protein
VGGLSLRQLQGKRGDDLVQGVLALVDEYRPLQRNVFAKLEMPEGLIQEFLHPPASPEVCIFAQTTHTVSADLKSKITPCQFGGNPDCSQCGGIACMALAAVGNFKLALGVTAGDIYRASTSISKALQSKALPAKTRAA